ncbi:MAG TPA: basic secretory protein-like protein [Pyrinomonadaceae bacterium]|jgi:predicted metalloprotease with PDZ domain
MRITFKTAAASLFKILVTLLPLWVVTPAAFAQALDVKIKVLSGNPARIHVEGKRGGGANAWSLRNFYGRAGGLAERVENFALYDESGAPVNVRKLAPGEFTAERPASSFSYEMKLDPPAFISDSSHVSWLTADRGLLMLADLLPLPLKNAKVELSLPPGWKVSTAEEGSAAGLFDVADAERAVFAVGRDLRERRGRAGGTAFTLATAGEWAFSDAEAVDSAEEILKLHQETMGGGVTLKRPSLLLLPLPQQGAAGNLWSAETRGATVVLLSGRLPSKLAARAQLDGALTHELFHLWVPNGLGLGGEYGWFYEGFTNYVALRAGMRRGQLTFSDYLGALGRAYDSYRAARGTKEVSLLEASQRRWSGNPALVYHKGLLVAFLYDLTLMRQTGGKSSLDAVYRELQRQYGRGERREDGDRAVSEILGGVNGMRGFVEHHVESAAEITLPPLLGQFGLEVKPGGARTHVGVADSLEPAQRELLRKLGYNEGRDAESRKLHERLRERAPR